MTNPSSLAVGREQIGALTQAAAVAEIQGLDASPSFAFIRHGHLDATVFWTPTPDGRYDWRPLAELVPLFAAEVVAHVASVLTADLDADQSAAFLSGADPRTAADRPESSGALWAFLVTHQDVTEPVSVPLSRADDGTVAFLPPTIIDAGVVLSTDLLSVLLAGLRAPRRYDPLAGIRLAVSAGHGVFSGGLRYDAAHPDGVPVAGTPL